uniref:Uncharacterized protein n=1 Tax=Rhizophora mucronata TaxID=61149 RepID=A0A2P2M2J9_RHIMU
MERQAVSNGKDEIAVSLNTYTLRLISENPIDLRHNPRLSVIVQTLSAYLVVKVGI